jgi:hypothetical protein
MKIQGTARMLLVAAMMTLPFVGASPGIAADMGSMPGMSGGAELTQTAGPYRIVLEVLPPEPFYTKAQVKQNHVKDGMVVFGGAAPVQPDDASHPNHHLIIHVFNSSTGKALRGGHVTMTYALASSSGAAATAVPVVEMRVIGKGPESTHYGNNVTLAPGTYHVIVTAMGKPATFTVNVS